jgi:hypothetical protein
MSWDVEGFRRKLEDQHDFPVMYMFKFIVPQARVREVKALTNKGEWSLKKSSKGSYTSVTIKIHAENAEEIIEIYKDASIIQGCIAL